MSWQQRIHQAVVQRKEDNLWRQRLHLTSPQGSRIQITGSKDTLLNFSSNDYLGLAQNSAALIAGAKKMGHGQWCFALGLWP